MLVKKKKKKFPSGMIEMAMLLNMYLKNPL